MMKRTVAVVLAFVCVLTLAGCQQSTDDLRRDAEFAKQCTEAGGRVYYVGFASEIIRCDFTTPANGGDD